ncbi:MAG TPA: hypothetical protein VGO11_23750 [Chthoniobacteraceae bacterium]|jgi:hypothetical protein|nr:hypothetical protein [Chthoniobacteraceae bacterium]
MLSRPLVIFVALALLHTTPVWAKGKPKPKPKAQAPAPAPAVPAAPPLPSELLQTYSANNLEHLLGPLNGGALPRAELMRLETEFKARLALGIPEEKAMLQAAINVCTAFGRIMDEREKAVLGLQPARRPMTSGALGANKQVTLKDWRDELQARREQDEARARQQQARASDAFILDGAANKANASWQLRGQPWRNQIQQLLTAERQAELVAVAPPAPPVPAVPVAPPVAAPPVAPAAAAQ